MHVVVIGAGIVGLASALELLRDGHAVTIIEPAEAGGEQAASYGNGTLLNPAGSALVTTADYFRVTLCALPCAIYRHTLTLSSTTPGQTGEIRGLNQTGGVICLGGGLALLSRVRPRDLLLP